MAWPGPDVETDLQHLKGLEGNDLANPVIRAKKSPLRATNIQPEEQDFRGPTQDPRRTNTVLIVAKTMNRSKAIDMCFM